MRMRFPAALAAAAALLALPATAAAPALPGGAPDHHAPLPPGVVNTAIAGVSQVGSTNWSGYAQATSSATYTAVEDTWKVPTVTVSSSGKYSSDWVGIDGFSNSSLVQCGTEADTVGGATVYRAWTEVLPASENPLTMTIHPGDKVFAQVKETKANTWQMQVKDLTTGVSQSRTATVTIPQTSAEVIHERPTVNGSLATLAKTTKVTQDPGSYSTTPAGTATVYHPLMAAASRATVYQIFMVNNAGTATIAAPSSPDSDNDGFAVAYGATSPAPPSS